MFHGGQRAGEDEALPVDDSDVVHRRVGGLAPLLLEGRADLRAEPRHEALTLHLFFDGDETLARESLGLFVADLTDEFRDLHQRLLGNARAHRFDELPGRRCAQRADHLLDRVVAREAPIGEVDRVPADDRAHERLSSLRARVGNQQIRSVLRAHLGRRRPEVGIIVRIVSAADHLQQAGDHAVDDLGHVVGLGVLQPLQRLLQERDPVLVGALHLHERERGFGAELHGVPIREDHRHDLSGSFDRPLPISDVLARHLAPRDRAESQEEEEHGEGSSS